MWKPRSSPRLNSSASESRPAAGEHSGAGRAQHEADGRAQAHSRSWRDWQKRRLATPREALHPATVPRARGTQHSLLMALSAVCLPTSPSSIVSKAGSTMPCNRQGVHGKAQTVKSPLPTAPSMRQGLTAVRCAGLVGCTAAHSLATTACHTQCQPLSRCLPQASPGGSQSRGAAARA